MLSDLLAARLMMGISLGFHIAFAVTGMAMPVFLLAAELAYRRTKNPVWAELAHRWAKGTAILFAVGAVSGTVLSFELGMLWPGLAARAGTLMGAPFVLEGFAFFLEAIFLGLYLYGKGRISDTARILAVAGVAVCGLSSGVLVVAVNSLMQSPTEAARAVIAGGAEATNAWEAFLSPSFPHQALHTALSTYVAVAFLMLGIHAHFLLHHPKSAFHRRAFRVALTVACIATPLQLLSGDLSAQFVAEDQPVKFAAMEAHYHTESGVGLHLGGFPDDEAREVHGAITIPYALSLITHHDPHAEIPGLVDLAPEEDWPPVALVHWCFQIMVGAGSAMMALVCVSLFLVWRKRALPLMPRYLWAAKLTAPLGLIAVEAGWCTTEIGRQPWIVQGVLRTSDAVTGQSHVWAPLLAFSSLYAALGVATIWLMRQHVFAAPTSEEPTP